MAAKQPPRPEGVVQQKDKAYLPAQMARGQTPQREDSVLKREKAFLTSQVVNFRRHFLLLMIRRHAIEHRPDEDFEDHEEHVKAESARKATQKAIDAMLESEAEDLHWTGPPSFQGVGWLVLSMLVLEDTRWPHWRHITQLWVDEKLQDVEKPVARLVGEDKLWSAV